MSVKNCYQCEKVFASSSSLSHHKRSHNKSDIVTCELCGKQFRTNNLKRHKESCKKVGLDSDKIMFKCDTCGMDFKEETKFNRHLKLMCFNDPVITNQCQITKIFFRLKLLPTYVI